MLARSIKQLFIGSVTLFVVGSIFFTALFYIWLNIKPENVPPVNGNNTIKFEDIEVLFADFFKSQTTGTYDVAALIQNPNTDYGASKLSYEFVFEDANGNETQILRGTSYILPNHSRYIVRPGLIISKDPASVAFLVREAEWERLPSFTLSGLTFKDTNFIKDDTMKFFGVVQNRSPYNLQNLDVDVVLYDIATDKAVAAGRTDMQTLFRGQDRFFQITWPYLLGYELRADYRVETNIFENSNFIPDQEKRERFQEFFTTESESDKR